MSAVDGSHPAATSEMLRTIRLAAPAVVLILASLVACGLGSEDGSGSNASAISTRHVLVVGGELDDAGIVDAAGVDAAVVDAAGVDANAGSTDGQPATDDLDEESTQRVIGDGARVRRGRLLAYPSACVLPNGAYDLAAAPTQSDDGVFWNVRFATEPKGIGGAACGPSGWVESSQVSFRQVSVADPTPPVPKAGSTAASCSTEATFHADYMKPVTGPVTSHFDECRDPGCPRRHAGIDIAASTGTPVLAAEDGIVIDTGEKRGGCGTVIEVRHPNGASTRFCHNSKLVVRKGDCVRRGQKIAEVGNTGVGTGPHMHLEFYPSPSGGAENPRGVFGY